MVGWHHQFEGQEFEHTPGVGEGQGSLACWSPWGRKELTKLSDSTNSTEKEKNYASRIEHTPRHKGVLREAGMQLN